MALPHKFISGNSTPVDRAVVTKEEWDEFLATHHVFRKEEGVIVKVIKTCSDDGGTFYR